MGKRKVINEENLENMLLPSKNDALGIAVKMLGFDRIMVKCQDGKERLCRVRGKLKTCMDPRRRHRVGLSLGLPARHTRRHILEAQKEPD